MTAPQEPTGPQIDYDSPGAPSVAQMRRIVEQNRRLLGLKPCSACGGPHDAEGTHEPAPVAQEPPARCPECDGCGYVSSYDGATLGACTCEDGVETGMDSVAQEPPTPIPAPAGWRAAPDTDDDPQVGAQEPPAPGGAPEPEWLTEQLGSFRGAQEPADPPNQSTKGKSMTSTVPPFQDPFCGRCNDRKTQHGRGYSGCLICDCGAWQEPADPPGVTEFEEKLRRAINSCSKEQGSDTPDFILAAYLQACLAAFDAAVTARTKWDES